MLILRHLTDEALASAVELNHAEFVRLEGRLPGVEFQDGPDAILVFAGDTWPQNTVAGARFEAENAHRRVGEILERHLKEKVACNWVVGPASQPKDLGKHLRAHGFSCRIHCAGMACDLGKLPAAPPAPRGFEVGPVNELPPLRPLTTDRRQARHQGRLALSKLKPRQVWDFSVRMGEKPVGETSLIVGAGVAGIYGVEVLEKYRRKGIGTALVHAALAQARELGFSAAVLSATGMGRAVYERLGFREVCKLSFWKYGKMRQQQPKKLANWLKRMKTNLSAPVGA